MNKHNGGFHILRVGMGITFLWIGLLILRDPLGWGGYLMPWASAILVKIMPIQHAMIETAILDILIGIFLIIDRWVWVAAALAAGHMIIVLATTGINDVTVRDIAILTAGLALFYDDLPTKIRVWAQQKLHINSVQA
jgi:uncharacterized membrane protein YphA (DoxX/SURF4 family)